MLKRQRPTAQGRRCKCTGCSESTACHEPRFPPASGAFEAASCFLSRVTPQLYSQALQRPTAQGRRCKCTGCSESTACHRLSFPPASGAFEAASCFLSRVNPQLYSQALQRPTAQGRRCKCTGCSESTACHRPRFPSKWRLQGRLLLFIRINPQLFPPSTSPKNPHLYP